MCTLFLIVMKKSHSHLSKLIQSHRDETKHLLLKGGKNTAESYHHFMNFPVHCWSSMSTWKQYGCCLCFPKAHKKPGLNTAAQTATQTVATRVYLLCKSDSVEFHTHIIILYEPCLPKHPRPRKSAAALGWSRLSRHSSSQKWSYDSSRPPPLRGFQRSWLSHKFWCLKYKTELVIRNRIIQIKMASLLKKHWLV